MFNLTSCNVKKNLSFLKNGPAYSSVKNSYNVLLIKQCATANTRELQNFAKLESEVRVQARKVPNECYNKIFCAKIYVYQL